MRYFVSIFLPFISFHLLNILLFLLLLLLLLLLYFLAFFSVGFVVDRYLLVLSRSTLLLSRNIFENPWKGSKTWCYLRNHSVRGFQYFSQMTGIQYPGMQDQTFDIFYSVPVIQQAVYCGVSWRPICYKPVRTSYR